jgi:hypothetical protein
MQSNLSLRLLVQSLFATCSCYERLILRLWMTSYDYNHGIEVEQFYERFTMSVLKHSLIVAYTVLRIFCRRP